MGFTSRIELRIMRGEDVNIVPLFSKILEQVGNVDHVPVKDGSIVFSDNTDIHDLAPMASVVSHHREDAAVLQAYFRIYFICNM